jgi:beta-galactosidase/beta-glucuronidase
MINQIRHVKVENRCLVPAEAELRLTVELDRVTPTTEVRGRLMGPRCPYSSTVEIAYPLRPSRDVELDRFVFRVIIPEASLWDPVSPFLYEGPVELWEEGQRVDQVRVSHGLRSLTLGPQGPRLNGRPLVLHGREVVTVTEEQLLAWRGEGVNLLVTQGFPDAGLWEMADRLGFLVKSQGEEDRPEWRKHPSFLDIPVQMVLDPAAGSRNAECSGANNERRGLSPPG